MIRWMILLVSFGSKGNTRGPKEMQPLVYESGKLSGDERGQLGSGRTLKGLEWVPAAAKSAGRTVAVERSWMA